MFTTLLSAAARPIRRTLPAAVPLALLCALPLEAQLYPASQWGDANLALPQSQFITESTFNQVPNFEPIVDFTQQNRYRRLARSIGRLDLRLVTAFGDEAGISTCTGTLIDAGHLITNHHCVPGLDPNYRVAEASLLLNYLDAETANQVAVRYPVSITPVETSEEMDYSILSVDGNPGSDPRWGYIPLRVRNPEPREELFIIHHPAGQPQRLTRRNCRLIDSGQAVSATLIRHRCDTLGGSSGSLIFSDNNLSGSFDVVALHYAGFREPGPGVYNSAKPLATIVRNSGFLQGRAQAVSSDGTATAPTSTPTSTSAPPTSDSPPRTGAASGTNVSGIPQGCSPGGSPQYGPVQVGTEVILGRHRAVDGNDNWADAMNAYVGQRTTVRQLGGTGASGCAQVQVDVDDGEWAWRVRDLTLPAGSASSASGSIGVGQSVDGVLVAATSDRYSFSASAGDVVTISMEGEFDGYLELADASGDIVAQNDDGGEGVNPLIENHVIGQSGQYTIVARAYGNSGAGPYRLFLNGGASTLTPGRATQARLPLGEEHDWSFTGELGSTVSISAESDAFDTFLELRGPNGSLIEQNDDGGDGTNSLIQNFRLPSSGTFSVRVRSYTRESGGNYTLRLDGVGGGGSTSTPVTPPSSSGGRTLTMGGTASGNLVAGNRDSWSFQASSGQTLTISMNGEFDGVMDLLGPNGAQLTSDDDSGGGMNPLISGFRAPSSGTYTVVVRAFSSSASGSYRLTLGSGSGSGGSSTPSAGSNPLRPAEAWTRSRIPNGGQEDWTFGATSGQTVTIEAESDAFDTLIELLGPNGSEVTRDDDGGQGLNSRISGFRIPSTGTYTIRIRSFGQEAGGAYNVRLMNGGGGGMESSGPSGGASGTTITFGGSRSGNLQAGGRDVWNFTASAGQRVTIGMTASFDGVLELRGPDGSVLTENDDGGEGLNPLISGFALPSTGQYGIVVRSYNTSSSGAYTLTLGSGEPDG